MEGEKPLILIADDDADIRGILRVKLEAVGLRVVEAADGQDAIDKCKADRPALIVMDVRMPVMSGWDFAQALLEQGVKVPDSYKFAINAISGERTGKTVDDFIEGGMFCMGNPDTCIRVLKKYQAAGVDQVLCFMQCGSIPHQNIMDSIRLFGKYVIPYFRPQ